MKPANKSNSFLSYVWSGLIITCIVLLTVHLVVSATDSSNEDDKLIEQTFTSR